jgi:hypothetical protein
MTPTQDVIGWLAEFERPLDGYLNTSAGGI